jgi:hypothetical protein
MSSVTRACNQALEQSKTTLQRSEAQLRSYRDMGTGGQRTVATLACFVTQRAGFDALVEEYTRLVERLEDRQWTMKVAGGAAATGARCCCRVFSRAGRKCRLRARRDGTVHAQECAG